MSWRLSDKYDASLLHFDGPNGSTAIVDENPAHVWTAAGNAQISTAQSKFGGSSLLLDGVGDYISTPDHPDFFQSTNPFAIEAHIRLSSLPAGATEANLCSQYVDANNFCNLTYYNYGGTYGWIFQIYSAAARTVFLQQAAGAAISTATWYHIMASRSGNDWKLFQAGSQIATLTDADPVPDFAGTFYIGSRNASAGFLAGNIDEFRLSRGTPRQTAAFTVSTKPYRPKMPVQAIGG